MIPLSNRRALGAVSVFGVSAPARPALSQATARVQAAKAAYDQAAQIYERVKATYPNLVSLMGQDKANQTVKEGADAMNAAAAAYRQLVGGSP